MRAYISKPIFALVIGKLFFTLRFNLQQLRRKTTQFTFDYDYNYNFLIVNLLCFLRAKVSRSDVLGARDGGTLVLFRFTVGL